jgi:hypothetical protein
VVVFLYAVAEVQKVRLRLRWKIGKKEKEIEGQLRTSRVVYDKIKVKVNQHMDERILSVEEAAPFV